MSVRRGLPAQKKMRHDQHYVDSLVVRDGEVVGRMIAIEQVEPNPDQPRKDMGDLESLAASITEQGIIEPLIVNKEGALSYTIVSGERRFHAAKLAGLTRIPCITRNLEKNEILEIALVENLQRKDLHPLEEADGLENLFQQFRYTHDQIAKKLGKSRSTVTETLTLAKLTDQVRQAAMDAGISAKSVLLAVARLDEVEDQLQLIDRIAKGAGREEARKQSKKQQRAKPFTFNYRSPDKAFSFNLRFKKSEVERDELILALERVLADLKTD